MTYAFFYITVHYYLFYFFAICLTKLKNETSFKKYIAQEPSSFKYLME